MKSPSVPHRSAAVECCWQLWVWFDGHLQNLPTHARASVGARVIDQTLTLLDLLNQVAWLPRRSTEAPGLLAKANQRVSFLRLLVRGMHARQHLSDAQYEHASKQLEALGKMIGGWLQALSRGT